MSGEHSALPTKALTVTDVRGLLVKSRDQIAAALPRHMDADRCLRIAMTTIQNNPDIMSCNPKSLIGAIIQASQLGLECDHVLGHAYLVPFAKKVQLIVGYKGYLDLMRRSGMIQSVSSHLVYQNEDWNLEYGDIQSIRHKPLSPGARGELIIGGYAVAKFKDGGHQFEFMWREEIEAIRETSLANKRNKADSPWMKWPDAMWRKTPIRQLAKYVQLSPELSRAAVLDEQFDSGIDQELLGDFAEAKVIDVKPKEPETELKDKIEKKKEEPVIEDEAEEREKIIKEAIKAQDLLVDKEDLVPVRPEAKASDFLNLRTEGFSNWISKVGKDVINSMAEGDKRMFAKKYKTLFKVAYEFKSEEEDVSQAKSEEVEKEDSNKEQSGLFDSKQAKQSEFGLLVDGTNELLDIDRLSREKDPDFDFYTMHTDKKVVGAWLASAEEKGYEPKTISKDFTVRQIYHNFKGWLATTQGG